MGCLNGARPIPLGQSDASAVNSHGQAPTADPRAWTADVVMTKQPILIPLLSGGMKHLLTSIHRLPCTQNVACLECSTHSHQP